MKFKITIRSFSKLQKYKPISQSSSHTISFMRWNSICMPGQTEHFSLVLSLSHVLLVCMIRIHWPSRMSYKLLLDHLLQSSIISYFISLENVADIHYWLLFSALFSTLLYMDKEGFELWTSHSHAQTCSVISSDMLIWKHSLHASWNKVKQLLATHFIYNFFMFNFMSL